MRPKHPRRAPAHDTYVVEGTADTRLKAPTRHPNSASIGGLHLGANAQTEPPAHAAINGTETRDKRLPACRREHAPGAAVDTINGGAGADTLIADRTT